VESELDRVECGEMLEEGRDRARLRRRVHEPEQERRRLLGQELSGQGQKLGRRGGADLFDPGRVEVIGVQVLVDHHRRDAQQQLGRLRRVDLDGERLTGARDVDDTRLGNGAGLLDVFDCHRTVTVMIQRSHAKCLTSEAVVR
jgi:hypothetical protein